MHKYTYVRACTCNVSELKPFCYYAIVDITMQPPYVEGVAIQCDESSLDHCQPDSDSVDTTTTSSVCYAEILSSQEHGEHALLLISSEARINLLMILI